MSFKKIHVFACLASLAVSGLPVLEAQSDKMRFIRNRVSLNSTNYGQDIGLTEKGDKVRRGHWPRVKLLSLAIAIVAESR